MEIKELFERIQQEFGDKIIELVEDKKSDPFIKVSQDVIVELGLFLRDEKDLLFDYLVNLTGMDYGSELGVVYHIQSISHNHKIVLKVILPKDNPSIQSVEKVWKTANWHEREAYDMFGIIFENHPFLVRILTPYDWEGYPLRKDYKQPEFYHGIQVGN